MRILANPLKGDPKVISGEPGSVGLGVLSLILEEDRLKEIAEKLNINKDSKILIINTEDDTDPENYKRIVWDGLIHRFKEISVDCKLICAVEFNNPL